MGDDPKSIAEAFLQAYGEAFASTYS